MTVCREATRTTQNLLKAHKHAAESAARDLQADAGTRTPDPFITSEVLYQLSYVGADVDASADARSSGAAQSPRRGRQLGQQRLAVLLAEGRADAAHLDQLFGAARAPAQHLLEHRVGGHRVGGLAFGARRAPRPELLEARLVHRLARLSRRHRAERPGPPVAAVPARPVRARVGAADRLLQPGVGLAHVTAAPVRARLARESPKWSRIWRLRQRSPSAM